MTSPPVCPDVFKLPVVTAPEGIVKVIAPPLPELKDASKFAAVISPLLLFRVICPPLAVIFPTVRLLPALTFTLPAITSPIKLTVLALFA